MKKVSLYVDGGSRGNPGPAGIGVVIEDTKGKALREFNKYIGIATNNIAEYNAVIYGLQEALIERADEVDLYVDSELVAQQLSGEYRVKSREIKPLFELARHLISGFKKININHIDRDKNKKADKLVNKAINLGGLL